MKLRHRRPPVPPVRLHDGTRWIACHSTTCGHLATRHTATRDGRWRCTDCRTLTAYA